DVAAISGLTITNGYSNYGGAILNGGVLTLTLTGCTVSGNYAADSGGGIYNPRASDLTLSGCTLSNNTAAVDGGGLYNGGGATVSFCTVSGNSAGSYAFSGGGIYADPYGGPVSGSNNHFSKNTPGPLPAPH